MGICKMSARKTATRATWFSLAFICLYVGSCNAINKATPAFVVVPRPLEQSQGSRLVWLKNTTVQDYVKQMDDFLQNYQKLQSQSPDSYSRCSWTSFPDRDDKSCSVPVQSTKMTGNYCRRELNYGFDVGEPCFFLRLDKLVDWEPDAYTTSDTTSANLPGPVRDSMEREMQHGRGNERFVWINCEGEYDFDRQWIGPMSYQPLKGLPTYFFNYKLSRERSYLSPFVTLHLPYLQGGAAVNVVCRAYAKNILQDVDRSIGAIHFQVLADFGPKPDKRNNPTWRSEDDLEEEHGWSEENDAGEGTTDAGKDAGRDAGRDADAGWMDGAHGNGTTNATNLPPH